MPATDSPATSTADREILITRDVAAPRELVWTAFTEPRHVAQWWGPNGFTNTIHVMHVRPGGTWRFIMHGPDGTNYTQPDRLHRGRPPGAAGVFAPGRA